MNCSARWLWNSTGWRFWTYPSIIFSQYYSNTEYMYEKYINYNRHRYISKYRLSDHNLPIERGRYVKPKIPKELRLCTKCKLAMGNEIHVLLECKNIYLKNLNDEFLNEIITICQQFTILQNSEKVIYLLKACDRDVTAILAKWLEKIHYYYKSWCTLEYLYYDPMK